MDSYKQELLNEYTEMINKKGAGVKELNELRNKLIDVVEDDYEKTSILGLDKFSQKRGYFRYGETFNPSKDDIPMSIQEVKSDLAKLKSIMLDPSSSVEGAQDIVDRMSKYSNRELTNEEALNIVRVLGEAQRKGVITKKNSKELSDPIIKKIVGMVDTVDRELTDDEINALSEKINDEYKQLVGLAVHKAPPSIVTPTPKVRKMTPQEKGQYGKLGGRPVQDEHERKPHKVNERLKPQTRTTSDTKSGSVSATTKKVRLSEGTVHKSRGKRPHTTQSKTRRGR